MRLRSPSLIVVADEPVFPTWVDASGVVVAAPVVPSALAEFAPDVAPVPRSAPKEDAVDPVLPVPWLIEEPEPVAADPVVPWAEAD